MKLCNYYKYKSIHNESTTTIDQISNLGDHGGTPGQPAQRNNPALPKFPNFEGHWFPKQYRSKLQFDCYLTQGNNRLDIHIDRDKDTYLRYFTVRVDGLQVYQTIIGGSGYDGNVICSISTSGTHVVELEIRSGSYVEHGWKLIYFWPYISATGHALNVEGEYFPKLYYAPLEYWIECGDDIILNIEIQRVNDPHSRYLSVYLDGNIVVSEIVVSGTHQLEFNIGDYADWPDPENPIGNPTMHELKLQIRSGSYCEFGWHITLCAAHYESVFVELDYMNPSESCPGHRPPDSVFEYIEVYYKIHGYERVDFQIGSGIRHQEEMPADEFVNDIVPAYFDHKDDGENWRYVLFGHIVEGELLRMGYVPKNNTSAAFLADYHLKTENNRRTTLLHEFGHTVGIIEFDLNGDEDYCDNRACCMAELSMYNAKLEPWYCGLHWSLRTKLLWEYWGNEWPD